MDRILHPLRDELALHYVESVTGTLDALTDTGRFHIARLQLNRPALLRNRQIRCETQQDRADRAAVIALLRRVEDTLNRLQTAIGRVRAGGE